MLPNAVSSARLSPGRPAAVPRRKPPHIFVVRRDGFRRQMGVQGLPGRTHVICGLVGLSNLSAAQILRIETCHSRCTSSTSLRFRPSVMVFGGSRPATSPCRAALPGCRVWQGEPCQNGPNFRPPRVATAAGRFVSIQTGKFRCLNLLCYVFQVRRESIRDLGRIISRLRDVVAHLENAREHRQYWD